jgi:hypothetical protein
VATNTIITDAKITKEALSILHNSLGFTKSITKEYSSQFAQTGAKIGATINIRKPNRYVVQQGPSITPQSTTESYVPLTLNRQWVVPIAFSTAELTLSIDEFSARYIRPAISKLASVIDLDCTTAAITGKYADGTAAAGDGPVNFTIGTPGTVPGTAGGSVYTLLAYNSPACYLNAGRILDINAAPRDSSRTICIDPAANAMSVGGLSGLFNPQGIISTQYKSGLLGNALGFDFVMDQNVYTLTAGTQLNTTAATMQATWTTGSNFSWTVDSSDNTKTLKAGSTFTVADCYHVNPETQQNTGVLMQWVVTADTTLATGTNSIPISPTPIVAGSTVANGNCSVAPTTGKAITMTSGTNSVVSPQNLAFHREAFTLGTADLEIPNGLDMAHRESMDGISIRFIRDYDVMSDFVVGRLDVLGGFSNIRPELAVRIAG